MKEITVTELKQLRDAKADIQLIDIREQHEVDNCAMGGEHILMGEIMQNLDKISKTKKVIVHCKMGGRSSAIVNALEVAGFDNVYNLKGGIIAWANEIEPDLKRFLL